MCSCFHNVTCQCHWEEDSTLTWHTFDFDFSGSFRYEGHPQISEESTWFYQNTKHSRLHKYNPHLCEYVNMNPLVWGNVFRIWSERTWQTLRRHGADRDAVWAIHRQPLPSIAFRCNWSFDKKWEKEIQVTSTLRTYSFTETETVDRYIETMRNRLQLHAVCIKFCLLPWKLQAIFSFLRCKYRPNALN